MASNLKAALTLDDGLLLRLSGRPDMVTEFPFLAPLRNVGSKPGCSRCQQKARLASSAAVQTAKSQLLAMGDDRKRKFAQMAGARQLTVVYTEARKLKKQVIRGE